MATNMNAPLSAKTQYLIKKWDKRIRTTESAIGPMNMERKAALAVSLENTHHRLRVMESTQPASIGSYKRYALDIVNAVVPNLIVYDIAAVQPIDNKVGMINYISYNYGSDKGQTKAGDMFASSINMGQSDPNYTADYVDNEMIPSADAAAGTNLQWTPVVPGTIYVLLPDGSIARDMPEVLNAEGKVTIKVPGKDDEVGTIDYSTGAIKINNAAADISVSYNYDNQSSFVAGNADTLGVGRATNIPEVALEISSLPVVAKSRKMKAVYAFDAAYELEKEYGQDIDTLLATEVAGEIAHEIDMEIANDIFKMANAGKPIVWSKSIVGNISLVDHYDSFYAKLIEGANVIFGATRKIQPNFIVCGLGVLSVIQVMRNFTPSGVQAIGPHFAGTLGAFKVFVSPDYAANQFVLGYKGGSFMDAGMFYCPYMPILSTDLLMTDDFAGRKGWATMYAKKMVNNRMYLQGYITD